MDSNVFSVLHDAIPRGHLQCDRVDAFLGERARHTSLQSDYGLLETERDKMKRLMAET